MSEKVAGEQMDDVNVVHRETTSPFLEVENVFKKYDEGGESVAVLNGVNMEVYRGTVSCVQGPSGCGKSTLLNIMGLLSPPDSGIVRLNGDVVDYANKREYPRLRRENVGLVLQGLGLIEQESVRSNIELPLVYGVKKYPKRERRRLVEEALRQAQVDVPLGKKVQNLSGGQKQRVAIARALVHGPRFFIADEPTAALDEVTAASVCRQLRNIADSGAAVLLATHDPLVADIADRLHRFSHGVLERVR